MRPFLLFIAICPILAESALAGDEPKTDETLLNRFSDNGGELRHLLVQNGVWLRAVRSVFRPGDLDGANLKTIETWSRDARNLLGDAKSATTPKDRLRWCGRAEKLVGRWKRFDELPAGKNSTPIAVSVRGLVAKPGTYRSKEPVTLGGAIRLAGGFHVLGVPECVSLYRNAHVKLYNLRSKNAVDPSLRSGDMVVVGNVRFVHTGDWDPFAGPANPPPPPAAVEPDVDFTSEEVRAVLGPGLLGESGGEAPEPPARIRVQTRTVEMPLAEYLSMFRSGQSSKPGEIYGTVRGLIAGGKAKIVGASIITASEKQKAVLESIREMISPCEPEPAEGGQFTPPDGAPSPPPQFVPGFAYLRPSAAPGAFETRNVGETLEIEAKFDWKHEGTLSLRLAPEYVFFLGTTTWQSWKDCYGRGDVRQPLYYTQRINTSLDLAPGIFQYVCAFVPLDASGNPDSSRKWLFFVKAEVLRPQMTE